MRVCIIDLGNYRYGGIPSYAYHVKRALESIGDNEVTVLSHTEKCYLDKRVRIGQSLIDEANEHDICILNGWKVNKKNTDKYAPIIDKILKPEKRFIVLHDPAEPMTLLGKIGLNGIITISKKNAKTFRELTDLKVYYTIHPYKRWSNEERNKRLERKKKYTISTSRVDFDKYYENILRAVDQGLLKNYRIHTGHVNRLYAYFTLDKKNVTKVDWKTKYYIPHVVGGFEFNRKGYRSVYDTARCFIDLSFIKNDGARSQYTFLEAFDFGVPIVLSERWDPENKYWKDGYNCVKVDPTSVESIVKGIKRVNEDEDLRQVLIANGEKRLKKHNHKKIGKKFIKILGG